MALTASKLRANVYRLLDEVLETGKPLEIERNGKTLVITPKEEEKKVEAGQPSTPPGRDHRRPRRADPHGLVLGVEP